MSSEKTVYWTAVAIMALFVGNHFASKYQSTCLADRAMAAVQQVGAEATHFAAVAQATSSGIPSFTGPEEALAKVQGQLAYVQSGIARRQVACARQQAQLARTIALEQVQHLRIVCPRQSITVNLSRIPGFISE